MTTISISYDTWNTWIVCLKCEEKMALTPWLSLTESRAANAWDDLNNNNPEKNHMLFVADIFHNQNVSHRNPFMYSELIQRLTNVL